MFVRTEQLDAKFKKNPIASSGSGVIIKLMKNLALRMVFVMAGAALLSGCYTNPVTGRKEFVAVSSSSEAQLGLTSFEQLKKETPINHDPAINQQVQRVGQRIAAVAGKDMPSAQWEFVVFESKEANAFCLPGGKVGVYTGILPITKDDNGLATVIGHEVGHATARHGAERMTQAKALEVGGGVLGSLTAGAQPVTQQVISAAYGIGGPLLVELPHSRKQESEADHMGLIYMAKAGYDPRTAVEFWERFAAFNKASGGQGTPSFLRTHPLDDKRIADLKKEMNEALPYYQAAAK